MKRYHLLFIIPVFLLSACKVQKQGSTELVIDDYKIARTHAVLFHQYASEYKALNIQAFNAARIALDKDLADPTVSKPRAVILDIDETVLDNSYYEAESIKNNVAYPSLWDEWVKTIAATEIAGVKDFIYYADANQVKIFYITNRKEIYREPTKINLMQLNLLLENDNFLLMREEESSKEKRRNLVEQEYHVSLLIGDNLNDFSDVFESTDNAYRDEMVLEHAARFGTKYILTPNCLYGQWEQNLSEEIGSNYKKSVIKQLKGFIK